MQSLDLRRRWAAGAVLGPLAALGGLVQALDSVRAWNEPGADVGTDKGEMGGKQVWLVDGRVDSRTALCCRTWTAVGYWACCRAYTSICKTRSACRRESVTGNAKQLLGPKELRGVVYNGSDSQLQVSLLGLFARPSRHLVDS